MTPDWDITLQNGNIRLQNGVIKPMIDEKTFMQESALCESDSENYNSQYDHCGLCLNYRPGT